MFFTSLQAFQYSLVKRSQRRQYIFCWLHPFFKKKAQWKQEALVFSSYQVIIHRKIHWLSWKITKEHRTIQVGRDCVRSLVQTPSQSRPSSGVRPDCSGLESVGAWSPPRTEMAQPPGVTRSTAILSSWGNSLSLYSDWTCCNLYLLSLTLQPCTAVRSPTPLPQWPRVGAPEATPSLGWWSPALPTFPQRESTPAPPPWGPSSGPHNFCWSKKVLLRELNLSFPYKQIFRKVFSEDV